MHNINPYRGLIYFYPLPGIKGTPEEVAYSTGLRARGFRQFFDFSGIIIFDGFATFFMVI